MSISYGELKKGMSIEENDVPYVVVDYQRSKMQQRAPVMRIKLRELVTGKLVERTYQGYDVSFTPASVHRRSAQYIYREDNLHYFMDTETYEQFPLSKDQIMDELQYLVEQSLIDLLLYKDNPVALELPITVELTVAETVPGVKGDTAQGGTKPAKLETGLVINVPLFINEGDVLKVDTRTGHYLSRS